MSNAINAALLAALISKGPPGSSGHSSIESELRKRLLTDRGATFNKDLQCYELRGKKMSVEMALFGPMSSLQTFTTPQE